MKKPKTVEEYIENSLEESRDILEELQRIIKSTVPEAVERIAWNVPNYTLNGVLTGFSVLSKHVSIGFSEGGLSDEERKLFEENGYKTGKGIVQIKFNQKVPTQLIEQTLKAHAQVNAGLEIVQKNEKVDEYIEKVKKWKEETKLLREICLETGLTEDFKWKHPCYTFQGNNIVLIHGFKEYCALLFHKGALLKDEHKILVQQTENVQSARQIRFTNFQEILDSKSKIKEYILEAIEQDKAGAKVEMKKTSDFDMPIEFEKALKENVKLSAAFKALTPGRQKGYLLHFSQAKQSKTRESRIEKCIPMILSGKGLNDYSKTK